MGKRIKFPIYENAGSVSIPIYRVKHKTAKAGYVYTIAWQALTGGRKTRQFADLAEAKQVAYDKAVAIAKGLADSESHERHDLVELSMARKLTGDTPVLSAIEEWCRARELTGNEVLQAAEAWAIKRKANFTRITVAAGLDRYLDQQAADGKKTKVSAKSTFDSLREVYGTHYLDTVSTPSLQQWLLRMKKNSTRNTWRKRTVMLFNWCKRQGYLPRNLDTEAELTTRAREETLTPGIITREIFRELLGVIQARHRHYLPALVLAGFAGLRRSEIHAQQWEDINLDRKFLNVSKAKQGTPSKRLVKLCPAAVRWLKETPSSKRVGKICGNLAIDRIRDIARAANLSLPQNAFRHSFITYYIAMTGNVARASLEAGNSPQIIEKHYKIPAEELDGKAWFKIMPFSHRAIRAMRAGNIGTPAAQAA